MDNFYEAEEYTLISVTVKAVRREIDSYMNLFIATKSQHAHAHKCNEQHCVHAWYGGYFFFPCIHYTMDDI